MSFPKVGDRVHLTNEWLEWANSRDGFLDDIKNQKGVIYKVSKKEVYKVGYLAIYLESVEYKRDVERRLILDEDLVHISWDIAPMIEFVDKENKIKGKCSSYNASCPICGRAAFNLVFAFECSNPSCQNYRRK